MSVRRRDHGQAAVEFAIALPIVVVLVLGVLHVVVVARDQLAIEFAAREGARAAAVAAAPDVAAKRAARAATTLRPLGVATSRHGSRVTVVVSHRSDPGMPMIGTLIGGVDLTASVTMEREPP